jgi:hypothetical protein
MQHGEYTRTDGGSASGVYPRFYMEAVEDPLASAQAGRPIFKEEERVEIIMPANQLLAPVHRVTDVDRQRFPREYDAFRRGVELAPEGTPLEEWPRLNRAHVAELKALGFRTVEEIAVASDTIIQRIMGGYGLRDAAKAYLDDAEYLSQNARLTADNDQLRMEVSNLQRQVTEQGELLRQVHSEMMAGKNTPHPLLTNTAAQIDPLSGMGHAEPVSGSSLAGFETKRRPGRPRKEEAA